MHQTDFRNQPTASKHWRLATDETVFRLPFDSEHRKLDVVLDENREVSGVSEQRVIFTVTEHTDTVIANE